MLGEQGPVKRIGMVKVDILALFHRHVTAVLIVRVLRDDNYFALRKALYKLSYYRGFTGTGSACNTNNKHNKMYDLQMYDVRFCFSGCKITLFFSYMQIYRVFFCIYQFFLVTLRPICILDKYRFMKEITTKKLLDTIIEGIRNRKGQRIVTIDLRKIKEAPVEMMVICEGQSNTQVAAIADEVDDFVRTTTHVHPLSVAGQENAEWIAMDYSTIFVHIMQREPRAFYDIEHLWADGKITELPDVL